MLGMQDAGTDDDAKLALLAPCSGRPFSGSLLLNAGTVAIFISKCVREKERKREGGNRGKVLQKRKPKMMPRCKLTV